jgi:hypothetical protein
VELKLKLELVGLMKRETALASGLGLPRRPAMYVVTIGGLVPLSLYSVFDI